MFWPALMEIVWRWTSVLGTMPRLFRLVYAIRKSPASVWLETATWLRPVTPVRKKLRKLSGAATNGTASPLEFHWRMGVPSRRGPQFSPNAS